jgi:hypothetical protein
MVIESPDRLQTSPNTTDSDSDSLSDAAILLRQLKAEILLCQLRRPRRIQSAIIIQQKIRNFLLQTQFLTYLQVQTEFRRLRQLSAVQIQRGFRVHQTQQQVTLLAHVPSIMSKTTDYEFPGGFRVAIDVLTPVTNTDGLSAGRLYKKENRPVEGSKDEKELLTDIKSNRYPKYKVINILLKDPEKLASNLSILDNLTYSEQFMLEFNMEDPFCICFPDNDASPASLSVDSAKKPITKDLFQEHHEISVEQVALSNRWYSRYAIFTPTKGSDRSFAKELE